MLTYLTPAAETFTAAEEAEWAERRKALWVRPLMEDARVRAALGLATPAAAPAKRVPVSTGAPAAHRPTKHAGHAHRGRFNRRALLESDR